MREINFQEVGMENYGPYIDPMIHTFTNDTITLMTGPNGIGKTMSLDAIPFTLFGMTSKGARGDDLVNNVVGKNCKTWVKFKINDDQYLVTRYQKYTKLGNTVVLNLNGVDIKSGHREVLPEIEKLICPHKSFMNTLMFGQKVKDFFTDLVDSDKKQIFRMILALELYVAYYKATDDRLKGVKEGLAEIESQGKIKQGLLADAKDQIEILEGLKKKFYKDQELIISELKKSKEDSIRLLEKWKQELSELKKSAYDLDGIIEEMTRLRSEIESLEARHHLNQNDLKVGAEQKKYELKEAAQTAENRIKEEMAETAKEINAELQSVTAELNKEQTTNAELRHGMEMLWQKLAGENKASNERIDEIAQNVLETDMSVCPTCEQDVNETTREALKQKVQGYRKSIEKNDVEMEKIEADLNKLKEAIDGYEEAVKLTQKELTDKLAEATEKQNSEISQIRDRLKEAFSKVDFLVVQNQKKMQEDSDREKKNLNLQYQEMEKTKGEAEAHQAKITEIENTISGLEQGIERTEKHIQEESEKEYDDTQLLKYQQRIQDFASALKQLKTEHDKLSKRVEILQFWKNGFSSAGIPSMLIDESIPFMNKQVSYYLDMLTNGRYVVSFDTLDETKGGKFRDKISVRVLDTHTQANARVQLSGGQTRIIDIATILTLGDLQTNIQDVKINILLFDEIFDALDDENIGYVAKVLNKLKVGKSIFIISHQHQDQVEADQTLSLS